MANTGRCYLFYGLMASLSGPEPRVMHRERHRECGLPCSAWEKRTLKKAEQKLVMPCAARTGRRVGPNRARSIRICKTGSYLGSRGGVSFLELAVVKIGLVYSSTR